MGACPGPVPPGPSGPAVCSNRRGRLRGRGVPRAAARRVRTGLRGRRSGVPRRGRPERYASRLNPLPAPGPDGERGPPASSPRRDRCRRPPVVRPVPPSSPSACRGLQKGSLDRSRGGLTARARPQTVCWPGLCSLRPRRPPASCSPPRPPLRPGNRQLARLPSGQGPPTALRSAAAPRGSLGASPRVSSRWPENRFVERPRPGRGPLHPHAVPRQPLSAPGRSPGGATRHTPAPVRPSSPSGSAGWRSGARCRRAVAASRHWPPCAAPDRRASRTDRWLSEPLPRGCGQT